MCIFNSINNILFLIYINKVYNNIILYDINNKNKINEIKVAHDDYIAGFRHYLDINKRDLLMSISSENNNIKLWDIII